MGSNDCLSSCDTPPYLLVPRVRRAQLVGHNWPWFGLYNHNLPPMSRDDVLRPPCLRDQARPHQFRYLSMVWMVGILRIGSAYDGNFMRLMLALVIPCNFLGLHRCYSEG